MESVQVFGTTVAGGGLVVDNTVAMVKRLGNI